MIALFAIVAVFVGVGITVDEITRAIERRHTSPAMYYPLPAPDASDEEFEAWGRQAMGLGNDRSYDRTLAEIRALPTTRDAA